MSDFVKVVELSLIFCSKVCMFLEVKNVISAGDLAKLRQIGNEARFVDGRISNPHNTAKKNLQIDYNSSGLQESSQILMRALLGNEEFNNFVFPRKVAPPMMCKYDPNMSYGSHSDAAFIRSQNQVIRSDVSCTFFLSDPESYDGGELISHLGGKQIKVKGEAGSVILYPSTTLHEVAPVTRGQRLVAITFIESQIPDEQQRNILYTVNEVAALEGYNVTPENRMRLNYVSQWLHRNWAR